MAIHHATVKKAEKLGVILEEDGEQIVAKWPKRGVVLRGASASDAMQQMQSVIAMVDGKGTRVEVVDEGRLVHVFREDGYRLANGPHVPFAAHMLLLKDKAEWEDPISEQDGTSVDPGAEPTDEKLEDQQPVPNPAKIERAENGVALDGAIAYREGTPAGDNPFSTEGDEEEYQRAVAWDEAWDAAADEASGEDEGKGGSVVNEKYRARYAELGHPEHCGDWLAMIFNNLVKTKEGTDVSRVDAIAEANGVDLSKYNRTNPGWQGRLRMTCRNLLARVVWMNDGVMRGPDGDEYKAPGDWMAAQRFKKPKDKGAAPVEAEQPADE